MQLIDPKTLPENVRKFGYDDFFVDRISQEISLLINTAFQEDLNEIGDVTSNAIFGKKQTATAMIISKQQGIFSGGFLTELISGSVDSEMEVINFVKEGDHLSQYQRVSKLSGSIKSILIAERTILNFLSRMSGVSTLTNEFVKIALPHRITILDTRKTFPGWRYLDKYAVKVGGGQNHRFGLFDMFLIKENHIKAAGGILQAVEQCKKYSEKVRKEIAIEVETTNLEEVKQALIAGADRIMLDNMTVNKIKQAVSLIKEKDNHVKIEISGGVNYENIDKFVDTGVDFISIGSLTHSAKAFDFSLLVD
ncbi:MAG: carboxylating nicotinate-nucleotide diphosphorylase [Calditrichaeota bacterium]|nr:carboxylating nicotinate-nucleotide diphosphorylase [Calditrichota bacterium]